MNARHKPQKNFNPFYIEQGGDDDGDAWDYFDDEEDDEELGLLVGQRHDSPYHRHRLNLPCASFREQKIFRRRLVSIMGLVFLLLILLVSLGSDSSSDERLNAQASASRQSDNKHSLSMTKVSAGGVTNPGRGSDKYKVLSSSGGDDQDDDDGTTGDLEGGDTDSGETEGEKSLALLASNDSDNSDDEMPSLDGNLVNAQMNSTVESAQLPVVSSETESNATTTVTPSGDDEATRTEATTETPLEESYHSSTADGDSHTGGLV